MIPVVFFIFCLLLFDGFSCLLRLFGIPAVLLEAELGLHDKPQKREEDREGQLDSTYDSHDQFVSVVVVSEVGGLLNSIVIHQDYVEHQETNNVGNVAGSLTDSIDQSRSYGQSKLFAVLTEGFNLPIVKLVILFDFLFDVLVKSEQGNQLVTLGVSADLKHNRVLRVFSQILEHWMMREVKILECLLSPVVGRHFNLNYQSLEYLHEEGELLVLFFTIGHQIKTEVSGFKGLLVFFEIGILFVFEGFFFSTCSIVIDFFED